MWRKLIIVCLLIIVIFFTLDVKADNCVRVRTVYPTYHCPTPYVAPVKYIDPYYKEQVIFVPKAIEVEVHRNHYYSIDSYYQQNLLADAIVGKLYQLQLKGSIGGTQRPITPESNNTTNFNPNPNFNNTNNTQIGISTYQNPDLSIAFKNSCIKCHDGKQRTAFLTADDKLLDLPKSKVLEVYHLVNTGKMPKNASPLDDKMMPLIDQWIANSK